MHQLQSKRMRNRFQTFPAQSGQIFTHSQTNDPKVAVVHSIVQHPSDDFLYSSTCCPNPKKFTHSTLRKTHVSCSVQSVARAHLHLLPTAFFSFLTAEPSILHNSLFYLTLQPFWYLFDLFKFLPPLHRLDHQPISQQVSHSCGSPPCAHQYHHRYQVDHHRHTILSVFSLEFGPVSGLMEAGFFFSFSTCSPPSWLLSDRLFRHRTTSVVDPLPDHPDMLAQLEYRQFFISVQSFSLSLPFPNTS